MVEFEFRGTAYQHEGGSWWFIELPPDLSREVERFSAGNRGGWGSVKVDVTIGATSWSTSLFPSSEETYVLPVKKAVRRAEGLDEGVEVDVVVRL
jgi:hypothetical protein